MAAPRGVPWFVIPLADEALTLDIPSFVCFIGSASTKWRSGATSLTRTDRYMADRSCRGPAAYRQYCHYRDNPHRLTSQERFECLGMALAY